ncbi:MAG: DMT family transporter [Zoogloea sp.]|uniref:DMT family transporter n=1 Tax=Zoogloea sp. TaxID=49181 RepID=UPI002608DA46|nr:DMT family transporter [Zoogloea sp.]MDD3325566.1 DMT family transporter [Zoogloea sp.]
MIANPRWIGAGLVALSALSFGAMAIFARFAFAGGVDVTALLFLRFLIAGALMAVLMSALKRPWPRRRNALTLALMGGVGYVAQALCFFLALQHASAGLVALLLYLYPFLVTLLGVAFAGERLTLLRTLAVLSALLGTALTIGAGLSGSPLGIALGLAAALIYSIYILVGNRVLKEEDPLAAAAVVMLAAAGVFGLVVLVDAPRFPASAAAWAAVLAIALISTVVAMVGFFAGIKRLGAADAATLSTLEPVVTFVLAAIFLDEPVSAAQMAGGAIVLGAVIALARGQAGTGQGKGSTSSR